MVLPAPAAVPPIVAEELKSSTPIPLPRPPKPDPIRFPSTRSNEDDCTSIPGPTERLMMLAAAAVVPPIVLLDAPMIETPVPLPRAWPAVSVPIRFPSTRLAGEDPSWIAGPPLKPMTLAAAAVVPPIVLAAPPLIKTPVGLPRLRGGVCPNQVPRDQVGRGRLQVDRGDAAEADYVGDRPADRVGRAPR